MQRIGTPINLKNEMGGVVLSFKCPYCHHTWSSKQEHPEEASWTMDAGYVFGEFYRRAWS